MLIRRAWRALKRERRAITSIEYAAIAAVLVAVVVTATGTLGSELAPIFTSVGAML